MTGGAWGTTMGSWPELHQQSFITSGFLECGDGVQTPYPYGLEANALLTGYLPTWN